MEPEIIAYYRQGAFTREDLQSAINEEVGRLQAEDKALDEKYPTPFEVIGAGGFIAEGIIIAIAVGAGSNLAADAAKAVWDKVLKKIRAAHGDDVIGPELSDKSLTQEAADSDTS